eukprot:76120-Lingulodinium_polyedra.AAC.1
MRLSTASTPKDWLLRAHAGRLWAWRAGCRRRHRLTAAPQAALLCARNAAAPSQEHARQCVLGGGLVQAAQHSPALLLEADQRPGVLSQVPAPLGGLALWEVPEHELGDLFGQQVLTRVGVN